MKEQNEYWIEEGRYRLRQAAGVYWLIDMEQSLKCFKKPLAMNEMGAKIWRLMEAGSTKDEIVQILSREYEVDVQQVKLDLDNFENELMQFVIENEV